MSQTLTFAIVKEAILNGPYKLSAEAGETECQYTYDDPNVRCAIGCALTDETLGKINVLDCEGDNQQGQTVSVLEGAGILSDSIDSRDLYQLQRHHDSWCQQNGPKRETETPEQYSYRVEMVQEKRKLFYQMLGVPVPT